MKNFQSLGRSLSKTEQQKIIGGYYAPVQCYTSSCTLTVVDYSDSPLNPYYTTYHGSCASSGSGCYCDTAYINTQGPVISNGGVSRCTVQ